MEHDPHDCVQLMQQETSGFDHVHENPLDDPDFEYFVDGSRFMGETPGSTLDMQWSHSMRVSESLPSSKSKGKEHSKEADPDSVEGTHSLQPGDWVVIKRHVRKGLDPRFDGTSQVLLTTHTAMSSPSPSVGSRSSPSFQMPEHSEIESSAGEELRFSPEPMESTQEGTHSFENVRSRHHNDDGDTNRQSDTPSPVQTRTSRRGGRGQRGRGSRRGRVGCLKSYQHAGGQSAIGLCVTSIVIERHQVVRVLLGGNLTNMHHIFNFFNVVFSCPRLIQAHSLLKQNLLNMRNQPNSCLDDLPIKLHYHLSHRILLWSRAARKIETCAQI
ncbi:uncharacterized protein LOC122942151 [Bufo gargarizans]|uniref:uncharacterized protein LOC122942151 n=1 Tax=Bufo gargarizans TaxID=30331 RepID=UPI001CF4A4A6|nr:uncharacterized protein LOC122942151 [Bufo gargarizans]